jgi:RHS repeat-associated protein
MQENGTSYYYHNDHLGTPQKLTDPTGNTVWSATYTAFGEAEVTAASTIENNLRFPGQYYDEETNLHYNWNRYYSPETGRYTQVDPIGLKGGINLFGYVENNPVNLIDSDGLSLFDPGGDINRMPMGGGGTGRTCTAKDMRSLSKGEINSLKKGGEDIHDLKGGSGASKYDLFKNRLGEIYQFLKGGKGEGQPTGLNINDFM